MVPSSCALALLRMTRPAVRRPRWLAVCSQSMELLLQGHTLQTQTQPGTSKESRDSPWLLQAPVAKQEQAAHQEASVPDFAPCEIPCARVVSSDIARRLHGETGTEVEYRCRRRIKHSDYTVSSKDPSPESSEAQEPYIVVEIAFYNGTMRHAPAQSHKTDRCSLRR